MYETDSAILIKDNQTIEKFLKEKIEQRMDMCRKCHREAKKINDFESIKNHIAKLEAYIDIWSFLEVPKN